MDTDKTNNMQKLQVIGRAMERAISGISLRDRIRNRDPEKNESGQNLKYLYFIDKEINT